MSFKFIWILIAILDLHSLRSYITLCSKMFFDLLRTHRILLFVILGFCQDNASVDVLISLSIEIYFIYLDSLDLDIHLQPWVIFPLQPTCIKCFLTVFCFIFLENSCVWVWTVLKQLPVFCFPLLGVLVYICLKCF